MPLQQIPKTKIGEIKLKKLENYSKNNTKTDGGQSSSRNNNNNNNNASRYLPTNEVETVDFSGQSTKSTTNDSINNRINRAIEETNKAKAKKIIDDFNNKIDTISKGNTQNTTTLDNIKDKMNKEAKRATAMATIKKIKDEIKLAHEKAAAPTANTTLDNIKDKMNKEAKRATAMATIKKINVIINDNIFMRDKILDSNFADINYNKDIKRLSTKIPEEFVNEFENILKDNLSKYEPGSGESVAAAYATLLCETYIRNMLIPYFYGGGHGDGTEPGKINPEWGSELSTGNGVNIFRYHGGLDCSGGTWWAANAAGIELPCYKASGYIDLGDKISFSDITPGDVIVSIEYNEYHEKTGEHIIMAFTKPTEDENGIPHIWCGEFTGSGATNVSHEGSNDSAGGGIINKYTSSSFMNNQLVTYYIIDMDTYYKEHYKGNEYVDNSNQEQKNKRN